MYDLIGDIHGHHSELTRLLGQLDYTHTQGAFRHPRRQAVFVGDFIDRGPQIAETLQTVRSMVEAGSALAVMGNHELNALAFHTPCGRHASQFLRPHTEKNLRQHHATLAQLSPPDLADALAWFRTLPFCLELDGCRVAHACWSDADVAILAAARPPGEPLDDELLREAVHPEGALFPAIEHVLKGPETVLPEGLKAVDKDGHPRSRFRVRWFGGGYGTYRELALPSSPAIPDLPLDPDYQPPVPPYPAGAPPVFVGHYWLRLDDQAAVSIGGAASPEPLARNVACLDYSIAREGHLAGYRFDGEAVLERDRFTVVTARQSNP
jgi:hypothetical protein